MSTTLLASSMGKIVLRLEITEIPSDNLNLLSFKLSVRGLCFSSVVRVRSCISCVIQGPATYCQPNRPPPTHLQTLMMVKKSGQAIRRDHLQLFYLFQREI